MKLIIAFVKPYKLDHVRDAMEGVGDQDDIDRRRHQGREVAGISQDPAHVGHILPGRFLLRPMQHPPVQLDRIQRAPVSLASGAVK